MVPKTRYKGEAKARRKYGIRASRCAECGKVGMCRIIFHRSRRQKSFRAKEICYTCAPLSTLERKWIMDKGSIEEILARMEKRQKNTNLLLTRLLQGKGIKTSDKPAEAEKKVGKVKVSKSVPSKKGKAKKNGRTNGGTEVKAMKNSADEARCKELAKKGYEIVRKGSIALVLDKQGEKVAYIKGKGKVFAGTSKSASDWQPVKKLSQLSKP